MGLVLLADQLPHPCLGVEVVAVRLIPDAVAGICRGGVVAVAGKRLIVSPIERRRGTRLIEEATELVDSRVRLCL
jgi:hypothetical protein